MKKQLVFLLGSPRSGTTILTNILGKHKEIAEWYEPYYIWEYYYGDRENDVLNEMDYTIQLAQFVKKESTIFLRKSGKSILVDKEPAHCLKIPLINRIFPEARYIHILRDGRDVVLSMKKEWSKRSKIINNRSIPQMARLIFDMLKRAPFLRYKLLVVWHELKNRNFLDTGSYFNKARWKGKMGWGPRFTGWQEYLQNHTSLEYNAMQWVQYVKAVHNSWHILPEKNKVEIRYEDLLQFPKETLSNIFNTLETDMPSDFLSIIPKLKSNNYCKWKKGFAAQELLEIKPIIAPLLRDLSYASSGEW